MSGNRIRCRMFHLRERVTGRLANTTIHAAQLTRKRQRPAQTVVRAAIGAPAASIIAANPACGEARSNARAPDRIYYRQSRIHRREAGRCAIDREAAGGAPVRVARLVCADLEPHGARPPARAALVGGHPRGPPPEPMPQCETGPPRITRGNPEAPRGAARIRTGDKGFAVLCLTAWLRRRCAKGSSAGDRFAPPCESGKPDSNRRPPPWQGGALPTELFPRGCEPGL